MIFVVCGFGFLVLGFLAYVLYSISCIRRRWEILGLLQYRFLAKPDMPTIDWVRCGPIQLAFSKPSGTGGGNAQLMACSPLGLCLRMQEMFTLCIPWESIKLVYRSKIGFFRADFIVDGFADNRIVYITLESTDPEIEKFIKQCLSAMGK